MYAGTCTCLYHICITYMHTFTHTHTHIHTQTAKDVIHAFSSCAECLIRKEGYTHTYIYTYIHAYIHSHTHTYIHTYIHTQTAEDLIDAFSSCAKCLIRKEGYPADRMPSDDCCLIAARLLIDRYVCMRVCIYAG
jgi:hypothetical protein